MQSSSSSDAPFYEEAEHVEQVHLLPALDELWVGARLADVVARQRRVEAARDPRELVLPAMLELDVLRVLARGRLATDLWV